MPFGPWPGGGGAFDSAAAAQAQILASYIPGLQLQHVKPNDRVPATNAATPTFGVADASMIGGGAAVPSPFNSYITLSGIVATDLLTQPFALSCRAIVNPPNGVNYTFMGLSLDQTAANAAYVGLASYVAYDATHLVLEFFRPNTGGAVAGSTAIPTSFVIDGRMHWYALLIRPSGSVVVLVDGAPVLTTIDISNIIGAAAADSGVRCINAYAGAADLNIGELIYGWVPPSLLNTPADAFTVLSTASAFGFIGDSMFAGSPNATFRLQAPFEHSVTQKFRQVNAPFPTYTNLGVAADTSTDVLARVAGIIAAGCDHYLHLYGVNDNFNHGGVPIPPATTQANTTAIINAIVAALPNSKHHVLTNLWNGSEQRPRGIGPNDATTDASSAAQAAAVALQPAGRARYLDILTRLYTSYSPVVNPGNAANGVMTQGDGTHPSKTIGQNLASRCIFDHFTFAW